MKRNRESKCRIKLIQEKNLSKAEQRFLDSILKKDKKSYSAAYTDHCNGLFVVYDMAIGMFRASRSVVKAGVAAREATETMLNFENAWREALC